MTFRHVCILVFLLQPFHTLQLFPVDACAESYEAQWQIFIIKLQKRLNVKSSHTICVLSVIALHVQALASWVPSFSVGYYLLLCHTAWCEYFYHKNSIIHTLIISYFRWMPIVTMSCSYHIFAITTPLHANSSFVPSQITWHKNIFATQVSTMACEEQISYIDLFPPFYSPSCICKYTPFYILKQKV